MMACVAASTLHVLAGHHQILQSMSEALQAVKYQQSTDSCTAQANLHMHTASGFGMQQNQPDDVGTSFEQHCLQHKQEAEQQREIRNNKPSSC
jgi:hypothetical protein